MKNEQRDIAGSRRQLFRAAIAGAVSLPFLALGNKSADADDDGGGCHFENHRRVCNCLLKGTRVSTPVGERAVEDLKIGDEVVTLSGPQTVKWIGYGKFIKDAGRPWHVNVMPVRIARSAIADQAPHRDLYISPAHSVFIDEALIPAMFLVNGTTIDRAAPEDIAALEYYQIEFDTHEVVFAEGAPVESFLYDGANRESFSNFVEYERLYGRDQTPMTPFAPILGHRNKRQKVEAIARSVISKVVDVRDRTQVIRDRLARRAEELV
jgi:hypothetical protein